MANENFNEEAKEQQATGVVDAGGFEGDAGTGPIAEDQESAGAAASAPATEVADASVIDQVDAAAPLPGQAAEQAQPQADLHEDEERGGVDWAVVVVILVVVIACLAFAIYSAMQPAAPVPVAQQQAATAQAELDADEPPFEVAELPEGVAAVVNGEEIPESDIDEYISDFRKLYDLTDDDDWAEWMVSSGYSAEALRNATISMYVDDAIVRQAVAELDVQVSDEEVSEIYDATRSNFATDEEWQDALEEAGLTDESFHEQCERQAQQNALLKILGDAAISEEDLDGQVLEYVKQYYPEYADATSIDEVDASVADPVREMLDLYAQQEAYTTFLDDSAANGDIKMSAAPADMPYSVNLLTYYFKDLTSQLTAAQQ